MSSRLSPSAISHSRICIFAAKIIKAFDGSNGRFVVKLISRGLELVILEYLKSVPNSRNHTIPITQILELGPDQVLIVIPRYSILDELESLTEVAYYRLRYQLVEVRNNRN